MPDFLACALRPGAEGRLPGGDAHLPELLPDDLPAAAVVNPWVRAAADVNRPPHPQPGGPRTNCLFPLDGTDGAPLYRRRLTPKNAEMRLTRIHRPYHAALEQALAGRVRAHGYAVLLDLHSFPAGAAPGIDAVLGDLCGRSAPDALTARLDALLHTEGLRPARNVPLPGGYILRRHASDRIYAVQLELSRAWYGAPGTPRFAAASAALRRALTAFLAELSEIRIQKDR